MNAWCKPIVSILIVLHAIAALFHQSRLKDGLLRRMLLPGAIRLPMPLK